MLAVKAKINGVLYQQSSSIAFDETSSYWLTPKTPNFSAFHRSPHSSLVSIGQHFVATRVVHLPKSTETSLITEADQSGPNHQLLQLCQARTAWSDSDQVVRAVHSCISWLHTLIRQIKIYSHLCVLFIYLSLSSSADAIFVELCVWSEERSVSVWYEPCNLAEKPNERSCSDQKGNGGKKYNFICYIFNIFFVLVLATLTSKLCHIFKFVWNAGPVSLSPPHL